MTQLITTIRVNKTPHLWIITLLKFWNVEVEYPLICLIFKILCECSSLFKILALISQKILYIWLELKNLNNATSLPPLTNYIREDIAKFTWGTRYCKQAEGCMIFHLAHEIFINVGMEMSIKRLLLSFIYTLFYQNPSELKF